MLSIRTTFGQYFDLFPGLKLSIEETSPLFSEQGSFSLPVELPVTDNNLAILGYPFRPDRREKFITQIDVIVSSDILIRSARMDIEGSSRNKSITASLFFRESPFYAAMRDKTLKSIFENKVRKDYSSVSEWIDYLDTVMCGDVSDDFYLFPVCAKIEEKENKEEKNGVTATKMTTRCTILNRPDVPTAENATGTTKQATSGRTYYALAKIQKAYDENEEQYSLPQGYGIAPFLKFTYVLQYTIEKLGYTLQESLFDTEESFKRLCFVHDTADCLVKGKLEYKYFVPEIKVTELLELAENFGCRFVVNEVEKIVTPVFWKDVLFSNTGNFSGTFVDHESIHFSPEKRLKLTIEKKSDELTPLRFNTFPDLFGKYGQYRGTLKDEAELFFQITHENLTQGVYFIRSIRMFVVVFKYYPNMLEEPGNYHWMHIFIEKNTLDWYDSSNNDFEEKQMKYSLLPLRDIPMRGESAPRYSVDYSSKYVEQTVGQVHEAFFHLYTPNDGVIGSLLFIDSITHINTVLQTTTVDSGNNVSNSVIEEEKNGAGQLMLAMYNGFSTAEEGKEGIEKTFFGSQDAYDNVGNVIGSFDLSTFSIHENFWARYDDLLQASFHTISGKAYLSMADIMNLKFERPVLFNGQKMLVESIRYEISDDAFEVVELKLKTIKKYE